LVTVLIVIEPPRGKRWRRIFVEQFGGDYRGVLIAEDEGLASAACFVIERLGGKTVLLREGERFGIAIGSVTNAKLFSRDVLVRFVKLKALIFPRQLTKGMLIAMFTDLQGMRIFLESYRASIIRACSIDHVFGVELRRRVDKRRLTTVITMFTRIVGMRVFRKAGVGVKEFIDHWLDAISTN